MCLASLSTFEQQSNHLKSLSWKTYEDEIKGDESGVEKLEQSVKVNFQNLSYRTICTHIKNI